MSYARKLDRQAKAVIRGESVNRKIATASKPSWDAVGVNYQVLATDFKNMPTDLTEAMDKKVIRGAVRAASAIVRKQMKKDFKKHQSKKTKTRELWSENEETRQKSERGAKSVYQSIMVSLRLEKEQKPGSR